jgi:fructose-1,6-bisphosphatase II
MDLVRVTEAGAISAAEWVGRGDKESADKSATDAMRKRLNSIDFNAIIAIGEGEKDESYGLFNGEKVGTKNEGPLYKIAIDPIEGTTPTAKGGYEAMSVIAMADDLYETKNFYMDKIAVGPKISKKVNVSLSNSPQVNVELIAAALNKEKKHVTVCVIDRPRTKPLVEELRKIGCRIKFISDCDVTACIATCVPDSGIDMYWSIGGAPEAVIAACAMKCMGGFLECVDMEIQDNGFSPIESSLHIEDLASGEVMFVGTGITNGKLLKGVRFTSRGPITNTIAMRSESGTIRRITTDHGN